MKSKLSSLFPLLTLAGTLFGGPWIDLFDGHSLDGWIQRNGKANYAVENGCIVGTTVSSTPNSFLCTDRDYGDFILEYEVLQEGKTNSGVQFRSLSLKNYRDGRVHGYQCELDPSKRAWSGGIYDEARRGWLSNSETYPYSKTAYQYGRWNHFRIEAIGSSLRTWINGIPIVHVIDDMTLKGFIALQVHSIGKDATPGARILWKNVRIQTEDLQPSPLDEHLFIRNHIQNNLSEAESALGWSLLWDGKTGKGWRIAGSDKFPEGSWLIQDGELILPEKAARKNKDKTGIVTANSYKAFELQLEFKIAPGANSGIKYFLKEGSGDAIGLEYQIIDNALHSDALKGAAGNRTLASLYDLIPPHKVVSTRPVPTKADVWHHARIVAHPDGSIQHWLDDFKVVEIDHGSPLFKALVERSKYAKYKNFSEVESSPILLQDHNDKVRFRNIKIRELN